MRQAIDILKDEHESTRAHIVIVNQAGDILMVNKAWCDFWSGMGWEPPCGEGNNFYEILKSKMTASASGVGIQPVVALDIDEGLRCVLAGVYPRYSRDYEFKTPESSMLFTLRIRPCDLTQGAQLRFEIRPQFIVADPCTAKPEQLPPAE